jgi:hypothetical protein
MKAELHSYSIVDDGESYQIELVFLTADGGNYTVRFQDREILTICDGITNLAYRAAGLNQEAKELDEKRKREYGL